MKTILSMALVLLPASAALATGVHTNAPPPLEGRPCCVTLAGAACEYIVFSNDDLAKASGWMTVAMGQHPLPPIDAVAFRQVPPDASWHSPNRFMIIFHFTDPVPLAGQPTPDPLVGSCEGA